MGEILGIGMTHYPPLVIPDEEKPWPLRATLANDDRVPKEMKDPRNWPEGMRLEYGEDEGVSAAREHRARLVDGFRKIRAELDSFNPDLVLIWGDDQYENFREDVVPAFCVLSYDHIACKPFDRIGAKPNVWGEPANTVLDLQGHSAAGRFLATRLLEEGIDVAYAYKPLHDPLGHAFTNTILFLDYDRKGFHYPVLPFTVNCYGSSVIRNHGGLVPIKDNGKEREFDPPSPTPRRCFEVGGAVARSLRDSPWRVALIASSSWSHAFLTGKNLWIFPDMESDRKRFDELSAGRHDLWKDIPLQEIVDSGQHEFLNWVCLAGAMSELGHKADIVNYVETYVFNSEKCLAIFRP